MLSSSSRKFTIYKKKKKEKKKNKRKYEKEEMKNTKRKKKRKGGEKEQKNKESKKQGKIEENYLYLSLPINTIPFLPCVYPFLPLHTISTKFYLSFSTIIIHIIWENN